MSSRGQPRADTKLVCLDDHLCGLIYTALAHSYPSDIAKADTFWKAWKAAPADPVEAAEAALVERYGSSFADGTGGNVARVVLAALGWEPEDKPA